MKDWMKEPPRQEEIKMLSWMDSPPTPEEIGASGEDRSWYDVSAKGLARGAIDAIPVVAAAGGGLAGSALGPLGAVGGGSLAYAGGKELQDILKNRLLGDEAASVDPLDQAKRVSGNMMDGASMEMGGQVLGKGLSAGASNAKKAALYMAEKGKAGGKALYKSGLKNIDLLAERYGKEPVSELLMKNGITGNAKQIYQQMDDLGEQLLFKRNAILKSATRNGAEVDVPSALKEAQAYVDSLRKVDNPEARKAVEMLQSRIDEYMASAAKGPQTITRELPTSTYVPEFREIKGFRKASDELVDLPKSKLIQEQELQPEILGYDAPTLSNPAAGELDNFSGSDLIRKEASPNSRFKKQLSEPVLRNSVDDVLSFPQGAKYESKFVPDTPEVALAQSPAEVIYGREVPASFKPSSTTVLDETERVAGPTPIQTSAWKTTSANKVGDAAWQQVAQSSEGKAFDKALSGGLRRGTEDAVERAIGKDASSLLKQHNSELGQILTTEERALLDAESAARKNAVTSVDGILSTNPGILAAKKAADFSKTTRFRTVGGKGLADASEKVSQYLLKSPRFQQLAQKNPRAFTALVVDFARKSEAQLPKAAQFDPTKPSDDKTAKQSFLDGN